MIKHYTHSAGWCDGDGVQIGRGEMRGAGCVLGAAARGCGSRERWDAEGRWGSPHHFSGTPPPETVFWCDADKCERRQTQKLDEPCADDPTVRYATSTRLHGLSRSAALNSKAEV